MASISVQPSNTAVHPVGIKTSKFCYKATSQALVAFVGVNPGAVFTITAETYAPGQSFIFADQTFDLVNTSDYTGNECDLLNGSVLTRATRLYNMLNSNPEIINNATVAGPSAVGPNYTVTVFFQSYIPFETFVDESGHGGSDLVTGSDPGQAPDLNNDAKLIYRLLDVTNGDPVTSLRAARAVLANSSNEASLEFDFAGELNGYLQRGLPFDADLIGVVQNMMLKMQLRVQGAYLDDTCTLKSQKAIFSNQSYAVAASPREYHRWEDYDYNQQGYIPGNSKQKFLSERPGIIRSGYDAYEWLYFICSGAYYHNDGSDWEYFVHYQPPGGPSVTSTPAQFEGVLRVPIGGGNITLLTPESYEYLDVTVRANIIGGPSPGSGIVISETYRVYFTQEGCNSDDNLDVYFHEPLGTLSMIRFQKVLEQVVDQDFDLFYRPIACDDDRFEKMELRGLRSYNHDTLSRVVMECKLRYTDQTARFVEGFRAANGHYIRDESKSQPGVIKWEYLRLEPDELSSRLEGELIVISASFVRAHSVNQISY